MNWLKRTYRVLADHIGKIMSALGAVLLGADILNEAVAINGYAQQYLEQKLAHYVGLALFILLFIRTWYTGWKAKQK